MWYETLSQKTEASRWLLYVAVVAVASKLWDGIHVGLARLLIIALHRLSSATVSLSLDYAVLLFVRDCGYAVLAFAFYRCMVSEPLSNLGLKRFTWLHVTIGAVAAALFIKLVPVLINPMHLRPTAGGEYFYYVQQSARGFAAALLFFTIALLSPIVQEVYFRGALLRAFRTIMPSGVGILTSAIVFALWHAAGGTRQILETFIFGVVAGILYIWKRNLAAPCAMHIALNTHAVLSAMGNVH